MLDRLPLLVLSTVIQYTTSPTGDPSVFSNLRLCSRALKQICDAIGLPCFVSEKTLRRLSAGQRRTVRFLTLSSPTQLPANLVRLRLCADYNTKLPVLPSSLRLLELGSSFNQPLTPGSLPTSLREITFSQHYNQ